MAPIAEFEKMMASTDREEMEKGMDEWNKWMEIHKKHFVDPGMALGSTKRVMKNSVANAKNDVGGYSIVQAETADAAAEIFRDSPHFDIPGAWIDIVERVDMSTV